MLFLGRVVLSNSRSSLSRQIFVLERDIVYNRSTACARDVSYEKWFPPEIAKKHSSRRVDRLQFMPKALKTSTVIQYHSALETAGNL